MKNNNGASIRKLSDRSLKNNRMRNIFAVLAIILTGILFTAAFSLTSGAMQVAQESTMREVGTNAHVGIKDATTVQYERVIVDPMVKRSNYNILIGLADNLIKHQAELRYIPEESTLHDMFIELEEGYMPEAENEIIVDTFTLDELGLPYELGEKIPLEFSFMGETVKGEFTVCGWYQGYNIAHASEIVLSESYWTKLKGSLTDEDFVNWRELHPEDSGVGLMAVNLYFENDRNLEEKVQTVIRNAGYEPGTELAYGINWAYMSSRMESVDPFTFIILFGAIMVILITGYLIIYNIFQISVINDIRFYGLLKTIGTTKKQIRRLVRRQALMLSVIGIPIGLVIGYGIGKLALPFVLGINDYQGMEISLKFNPWILVFGAVFSMLTVFISSRKPGKIAGNVSPIEAVKYTETNGKGRNKRTARVVVAAISLSIILLAIIMTAVGSFRIDQYMEQRIAGDYMIANMNAISTNRFSNEVTIDEEYLTLADGQVGIEGREEMWTRYGTFLQVDEKAQERFKKLDAENRLRRDVHSAEKLDKMLCGERSIQNYVYGYSEGLFSNLTVLDGTLDIEKFQTGNYVLLTQILGDERLPAADHVYHPGDMVTVEMITADSVAHEIKGASGETIDVEFDNLAQKEYEVMAIVKIPYSMSLNRHTVNGCEVVLPLSAFHINGSSIAENRDSEKGIDGNITDEYAHCFAVSYRVTDENEANFEAAIKAYTEQNPQMGYLSKASLKGEFENMVTVIATVGIALSVVIALIGVLNFINAIVTQIISRKREFAMLQSIGMTNAQLQKALIREGLGYIVISGAISFVLGSLLSWALLKALNNVILFFEYHFRILPFVIMIPALMLVAVAAPVIAYRNLCKKSIVERLRESE